MVHLGLFDISRTTSFLHHVGFVGFLSGTMPEYIIGFPPGNADLFKNALVDQIVYVAKNSPIAYTRNFLVIPIGNLSHSPGNANRYLLPVTQSELVHCCIRQPISPDNQPKALPLIFHIFSRGLLNEGVFIKWCHLFILDLLQAFQHTPNLMIDSTLALSERLPPSGFIHFAQMASNVRKRLSKYVTHAAGKV